jgi:hypothetical protein
MVVSTMLLGHRPGSIGVTPFLIPPAVFLWSYLSYAATVKFLVTEKFVWTLPLDHSLGKEAIHTQERSRVQSREIQRLSKKIRCFPDGIVRMLHTTVLCSVFRQQVAVSLGHCREHGEHPVWSRRRWKTWATLIVGSFIHSFINSFIHSLLPDHGLVACCATVKDSGQS